MWPSLQFAALLSQIVSTREPVAPRRERAGERQGRRLIHAARDGARQAIGCERANFDEFRRRIALLDLSGELRDAAVIDGEQPVSQSLTVTINI